MLKKAIIFFLATLIVIVLVQIYFLFAEGKVLRAELDKVKEKVNLIIEENESVEKQIEYYSHQENLEKELKSRFNYRKGDEKMIIIVP